MAVVLPSVHSLTANAASESSLVNRDNRDTSASSYSCQETAVGGTWVVFFVIPLASVSGVQGAWGHHHSPSDGILPLGGPWRYRRAVVCPHMVLPALS